MKMVNPRENIKYDIPKEWVENFKKGCCPVCAKTKFEFDKGMKVYCSKKCRIEYSKRIFTWQEKRDNVIKCRGEKCQKCGNTKEIFDKRNKKIKTKIYMDYLKEHPELVELKRKELMDKAENYYKKAQMLDGIKDYSEEDYEIRPDVPYEIIKGNDKWLSFEVDHIIAVALGGDFWDEANLQVLCSICHKEKTKKDAKKIAELRKKEKKLKNNKTIVGLG